MVTGPARRYNVTISRLMPIYNGNGARQGAQETLFVQRQVDARGGKLIIFIKLLVNELLNNSFLKLRPSQRRVS